MAGILAVGVVDGIYNANPIMAAIRGAALVIAALIIWKEVLDRKRKRLPQTGGGTYPPIHE